jgi:hypothetical protein
LWVSARAAATDNEVHRDSVYTIVFTLFLTFRPYRPAADARRQAIVFNRAAPAGGDCAIFAARFGRGFEGSL